jgi:putative PIN family toxin of toxin-antitoxin system
MLLVIDTDVVITALRSRTGASAELIRLILQGQVRIALSVAMVLEYESVATRSEQLAASELSSDEVLTVIDALASLAKQVENHFRWRPQLRDAGDEIILESAVNAGAKAIVTYNKRDFAGAVQTFGLELYTPRETLEILRSMS